MATKRDGERPTVTVRFFAPDGTVVEATVPGRLVEMPAKGNGK